MLAVHDCIVIGAGPAGLAVTHCLREAGVSTLLLDRDGLVGGAYRQMHAGVVLASPVRHDSLPGLGPPAPDVDGDYITAGAYAAWLIEYADHFALVPEHHHVQSVLPSATGWRVDHHTCRHVVVATGMFATPRFPVLDGLHAIHSRDWDGADPAHRRVLVIGGGTSAVEVAEASVRAGSQVVIAARKGRLTTLPRRVLGVEMHDWVFWLGRLPRGMFWAYCRKPPLQPGIDLGIEGYRRDGKVTVTVEPVRAEGRHVWFADGTDAHFDRIICATGFHYAHPFLPAVERVSGVPRTTRAGESRSHAGLFFIGTPCAQSVASEFLWGIAADAPRIAASLAPRR